MTEVKIHVENDKSDLAEVEAEQAEAVAEVIETASDASVEVARIEADKEVQIAELNAAVEIERINATTEAIASHEQDDNQWQQIMNERLSTLAEQVEILTTKVDQLSIPSPLLQVTETEPELTPETTPEAPPENAEEKPEVQTQKRRIIKI